MMTLHRRYRRTASRFKVRTTDGLISCDSLQGIDVERLPFSVWDSQRGLAFGEFVAACASEEVAQEVADALERSR